MPVFLDTSDDYLVLDRLFPVVWRQARTAVETAIESASRTTIGTRYLDAGGVVKQGDVWWDIPRALLATSPAPGDTIVDEEGVVWTVLSVEKMTLASFWRCSCRNLSLAFNLRDLVRVDVGVSVKEASGASVLQWQLYRAAVPARVQRVSAGAGDEHGAREQQISVEIYLAEPLPVGREARVVDAAGAEYKVTGYRNPDSIGEPFVYDAEITAWPSS